MDKIKLQIKHIFKHYKLKYSLIIGIIFLIINGVLSEFATDYYSSLAIFYLISCRLFMIVLWVFITLFLIMSIHYNDVTDRNMFQDLRDYNKTYFQLIRFFKSSDPYKMDIKSLPVADWKDSEGVILGKIGSKLIHRSAFRNGGEGQNYLLAALPGSGKTACQIIPSALKFGGSVVAIDIKGDILSATKSTRNIKIFSPADPDNSCCFNPLRGIENLSEDEKKIFLEQIAAVVIPEDKDGKYFTDGARDYFCGIALFMLHDYIYVSLPEISKAILNGNAFDWALRIKDGNCSAAAEYTSSYIGTNEKNVSGCYSELVKRVRPFTGELSKIIRKSDDEISIDTLNQGHYDVYIELPQDKIEVFAPITTLLLQNLMIEFMRRPDKASKENLHPILFLLDEFPQLQFDFKMLSAALSTLRSKGVSIFMAMQSISQLSNRYGENCCKEIVDTCQYISVMSAQDPSSRKFFQELVGNRKVLKLSNQTSKNSLDNININGSMSCHEEYEPIFQSGEFGNLGDNVIIYDHGKYIKAEKIFWFK